MRALLCLSVLIGFSLPAHADQIYGTLMQRGLPVADTDIQIVCGDQTFAARTNAQGSYSVRITPIGACELSVSGYPGASLAVYSYNDPVKYDLELSGGGNGFTLSRR
jgi:hypothetical protein